MTVFSQQGKEIMKSYSRSRTASYVFMINTVRRHVMSRVYAIVRHADRAITAITTALG